MLTGTDRPNAGAPSNLQKIRVRLDSVRLEYFLHIRFTSHLRTDWVLGGAFLRNVYAVYNYGSFLEGVDEDPSIQLLPVSSSIVIGLLA